MVQINNDRFEKAELKFIEKNGYIFRIFRFFFAQSQTFGIGDKETRRRY